MFTPSPKSFEMDGEQTVDQLHVDPQRISSTSQIIDASCLKQSLTINEIERLHMDFACPLLTTLIETELNTCKKPSTQSFENADVNVLIAREPPHRFCMMSPLFLQLFRFKSQDLSSSSLRLIYGPKTDVQAVRNLIARPAACASAVPIIFYRKDGEEVPCFVRVLSSALAHDDACTLAFEADAGCCASPRTQSAAPHVVGRQDTDSRGDAKSGGEHLPTCSLLSPGGGIDRATRIHVRAVRAASGSSKRRQAVLDSTQDGS